MAKILPFQKEFQEVIPVVVGNAEYNNFKALLFRISEIIEQQEPFEKTPTQKIKRFLYVE